MLALLPIASPRPTCPGESMPNKTVGKSNLRKEKGRIPIRPFHTSAFENQCTFNTSRQYLILYPLPVTSSGDKPQGHGKVVLAVGTPRLPHHLVNGPEPALLKAR